MTTQLGEAFGKAGQPSLRSRITFVERQQHADVPLTASLLRACRERPRGSNAAKKRQELPPPHSITSSAAFNKPCGTFRKDLVAGGADELLELPVGDWRAVDPEAADGDAMDWRLFRVMSVRPHAPPGIQIMFGGAVCCRDSSLDATSQSSSATAQAHYFHARSPLSSATTSSGLQKPILH
jgi:hypothetical protein